MNKNLITIIGLIALLCLSVATLIYVLMNSADTFSNDAEDSNRSSLKKITVVTDYSPTGYYVVDDTVAGFNYDLLQLFQTFTAIDIEIVLETSLEKSLEGLNEGKYDIVARNIPITSILKSRVHFSDAIAQNKQVLVQRNEKYNDGILPVRSHLDLAKKTLYVTKNSPVILRINNLSREIGDTIYYVEDDVYGAEQLAIMVAQREIDFAVCDENTARRIVDSQPELDCATSIGFTHFEAWAVSEHKPALLDSLNAWISKAKKMPKYDRIVKQYFK